MKRVSDALASTLIPHDLPDAPDPSARTPSATPVEAGCSLFGPAYRNILTKYWVSATSTPRRGRLTGFAALHMGSIFRPPSPRAFLPGQRGLLKRPQKSQHGASMPFQTHNRKTRRSTAKGGTPKNSLPPGSNNIIYISLLFLFIWQQTFSGSAGTRFQ